MVEEEGAGQFEVKFITGINMKNDRHVNMSHCTLCCIKFTYEFLCIL